MRAAARATCARCATTFILTRGGQNGSRPRLLWRVTRAAAILNTASPQPGGRVGCAGTACWARRESPGTRAAGRRQFTSLLERRRGEESGADYEPIRRDWVLGSEAFRQELLAAVVERVGPSHYGAPRQDTGLQQAERMVSEESERLGWAEDQLRARRKGHRVKVLLARRRRQETTRSLQWLAQRLQRGSWTSVSNLLTEPPQTPPQAQEVLPLCQ